MKQQGVTLLIALFVACQAFAQQTTNAPSTSATVTAQKPKVHWFAPVQTTNSVENLKPIDGLDTRAWTTVVGWHPGESAFATGERHEPGVCFFWIDLGSPPTPPKLNTQR